MQPWPNTFFDFLPRTYLSPELEVIYGGDFTRHTKTIRTPRFDWFQVSGTEGKVRGRTRGRNDKTGWIGKTNNQISQLPNHHVIGIVGICMSIRVQVFLHTKCGVSSPPPTAKAENIPDQRSTQIRTQEGLNPHTQCLSPRVAFAWARAAG